VQTRVPTAVPALVPTVAPTRAPTAFRLLHSSFLPDHDEVAASLALSQGGPGCKCAMCLRLAAAQPRAQPAMPPGLGGWVSSMAGKRRSALAEVEEVSEAEPAASGAPPARRQGNLWDAAYRAKAEAAATAGGETTEWAFDDTGLDEQIEALAEELEADEAGC
jgi:hypothetical protein